MKILFSIHSWIEFIMMHQKLKQTNAPRLHHAQTYRAGGVHPQCEATHDCPGPLIESSAKQYLTNFGPHYHHLETMLRQIYRARRLEL